MDVTQIDTEFHRVRYVDSKIGELRNAFVSFEQKSGVGCVGQLDCLRQSIILLYLLLRNDPSFTGKYPP